MSSSSIDDRGQQPTVDLASAQRRLGGNRSLLVDLARFCIDDAPGLLQRLHQSIQNKNRDVAARIARRLKCLAANFDAFPTVEVTRELEAAVRNGELGEAAALETPLRRQFQALTAILRESVLNEPA
jgi:HPt (histidine-containing phosphotransfer) domain-containing protein